MKGKAIEPTREELRRRTLRGFGILAFTGLLLSGVWIWARQQPLVDEARPAFREVLELNGRLWHALFGADRLAHAPLPRAGKKPRFNGEIGLETKLDLARWSMAVDTEGDGGADPARPALRLKMADLRLLPRTETSTEFKCIEGWSDVISYAGVKFSDFLKTYRLGTHSGAAWDPSHPPPDTYRYVGLETPDGEYYVSIDMESMLHPQTLLAYEMNGQELDGPNGAPLRLIIPVKYGIKSLKRIGRIFFSDRRPPDYWAEQGYDWFAGL